MHIQYIHECVYIFIYSNTFIYPPPHTPQQQTNNLTQHTWRKATWNRSCTRPVQFPPCMNVQGAMRRWSWMAPPCVVWCDFMDACMYGWSVKRRAQRRQRADVCIIMIIDTHAHTFPPHTHIHTYPSTPTHLRRLLRGAKRHRVQLGVRAALVDAHAGLVDGLARLDHIPGVARPRRRVLVAAIAPGHLCCVMIVSLVG